MTDDLFTGLSDLAVPPLAPASAVRSRGDQRRNHTRAVLAASAALVVAVASGTAVALARSGGPDALQVANTPTPTPSASSEMVRDSEVTWAVFPSVTRMGALVPDDWTSGQVQVTANLPESDRCNPGIALRPERSRVLVRRSLQTTDLTYSINFSVEDFASDDEAATVLSARLGDLRRCPTVPADGPGAGSQDTSTLVSSSASGFVLTHVHRECQQDHADCNDHTSVWTTKRWGHLLLTVTAARPGKPLPFAQLDTVAADFEQTVQTFYGREATPLMRPTTLGAEVGSTYYAAILWTGNEGQTNGQPEEADRASAWGNVLVTRLDCLDGAPAAVGRDYPGASHGQAVALLFENAGIAEDFVNSYEGHVEAVAKVTVACTT